MSLFCYRTNVMGNLCSFLTVDSAVVEYKISFIETVGIIVGVCASEFLPIIPDLTKAFNYLSCQYRSLCLSFGGLLIKGDCDSVVVTL